MTNNQLSQTDEQNSQPTDWDDSLLSRRRFLMRISALAGGVSAAIVGVPVVGFLLAPIFQQEREVWRDVGAIDDFEPGTTTAVKFEDTSPLPWAGVTAQTAAWLRRDGGEDFTAFAVDCSHLGCPVTWLPNADLFMCPCHGGVYNSDGSVAAGPPPSPLSTYPVRVQEGRVEIRTSALPLEAA